METLIIQLINELGHWAIFLLIFIENIFPPIPSELILTFGGFMTASTSMTVPSVIFFATLGSLLGALLLYGIGYYLGSERLKLTLDRYGKPLHCSYEDVQKALKWYARYEDKTVFFARMIPLLRSLISLPAGMAHMNLLPFTVLTIIGSLIWNSLLVYAGAYLKENWTLILTFMDTYSSITLALLILATLLFLFYTLKKHKHF